MGGERIDQVKKRIAGDSRPVGLRRGKPRCYAEWSALKRWGKLPPWEEPSYGYRLREVREGAGLTQKSLASLLGVTQQAVAQAERWSANPTVGFIQAWAEACGASLRIAFSMPRKCL